MDTVIKSLISSNLVSVIGAGAGIIPQPLPPSGYTAKAVHFDGTVSLSIASLSATDNAFLSFVMWTKLAASQYTGSNILFVSDPENEYVDGVFLTSNSGAFNYDSGNADASKVFNGILANGAFGVDVWTCLLGSINTTTGVAQIYNGDTDVTPTPEVNQTPFSMVYNALSMWVFSDGSSNLTGDAADIRIMPGTLIDFSVTANRRKFIDGSGKPVDPATATAALGTPAILFSGDHTTFPVNQGSGGAFTLTGVLTDAATHP